MFALLSIALGLILLIAGGELLVRGAASLARMLNISPLVIGLTVVAFGTSAPELAVSLQSSHGGQADIAVGNVVGSNIFNVLFILGTSALIVPLVVSIDLIRRDVPLMVASSILTLALAWDGRLGQLDGGILFTGLLIYIYRCIRRSRTTSVMLQDEAEERLAQPPPRRLHIAIQIGLIIGGLFMLAGGSRLLVDGAVDIATRLGVSQLIIGLTIVALGTSLPEVVTSIMAAIRNERDIAVGNVVGSNLFNLLCVLGLASLMTPQGITVAPSALSFDMPMMIGVAIACLPIFFTGNVIARWEGGLFFCYYCVYTLFLVLDATNHTLAKTLGNVMLYFVIPLTVLTLLVATYRSIKSSQSAAEGQEKAG